MLNLRAMVGTPADHVAVTADAIEDMLLNFNLELIYMLPGQPCQRIVHLFSLELVEFAAKCRIDDLQRTIKIAIGKVRTFVVEASAKHLGIVQLYIVLDVVV